MDLKNIEPTTIIGNNVRVTADEVQLGCNVQIGDNVTINARKIQLADNVFIDRDVFIQANNLEIGYESRIEARCRIAGMGGPADFIRIGEQTLLAHDTKLLVPIAVIGDYTVIHNHCLLNGQQQMVIGHNVWVGQNCVLNSEEHLTIGNNVGIGAYSSIYTHGYFGDLLEGCQVFKIAPVTLEDDVWILGCYNIISPGVTLGKKALVLTGANVTKDVLANHTVGGSPARDLTDRIVPYRDVSIAEKYKLMQTFTLEFLDKVHPGNYKETDGGFFVNAANGSYSIIFTPEVSPDTKLPENRPLIIFTQSYKLSRNPDRVTIFDLGKRMYTRTRGRAEVQILRFLRSYRARFVPADQPCVSIPPLLSINSR